MKDLTAKDVMTQELLEVKEDWPLDRLAEFFVENSVSGAPVTSEDGKLIGVVSLTDIVRFDIMPVKNDESEEQRGYDRHALERDYTPAEIASFRVQSESLVTVRDIMTPMVFNVNEDASVRQVVDTMARGRIHRIFVTRDEKVVGIIAALDILKAMMDL